MLGKSPNQASPQTDIFKPLLISFVDLKSPLIVLSQKIGWDSLENDFAKFYALKGAPSKPVRLMAGLLILKQMFNKSDEVIVEEWKQNPYYQYFTGNVYFQWELPCDPSDLVHFRKRIGEEGVLNIFVQSMELHKDKIQKAEEVITDTTVQEKNITYPTDNKLRLKSIEKLKKIALSQGITLKQTFVKELKNLKVALRFGHHPKRRKEASKAQRRIKTIAGILLREVKRKLQEANKEMYSNILDCIERVLGQTRKSKNKIYSLHEPDVACIAKGKSHKPYEFGSKISFSTLPGSNVVVDVSHFLGNPHDSKTLEAITPKLKTLMPNTLKCNIVDRGYRGKKEIEGIEIVIPNPKGDSTKSIEYQNNKRRQCKSRAAIEPIIGHIKSDHRMLRNFLKGVEGDKINAILAGAAFNFKKALNEIKAFVFFYLRFWGNTCFKQKYINPSFFGF
jgi:transposase, IS5 family